jgi:hypothetical protein
MKHILSILFIILSFSAFSQTRFPSVDSAKNYVLRYVKNSAVESFTNWRMQNVNYGTLELLDSLAGSGAIDSIWKAGDTLKYSKAGINYTIGTTGSNIDTTGAFLISVSQPTDSSLRFQKGATQTDYIFKMSTSTTRLITSVYNNTGSIITRGSVVYINGRHSSNLPTIALAQANNEANSYTTFALAADDIAVGGTGTVIQVGNISGLNLPTSSFTDGDPLYLSPTVAGAYTKVKPSAPNHITKIGTVTRAHPTLGSIQIKIENGWQLDELSDVQIAAVPNDSTILQFSRVDSLWKAVNPTTAMGNRFVKSSDSAAMLLPYLRKVDTLSLSNRITAAASGAIAWDGADSLYSSAQLKKGIFRTYDFDGTSGASGIPQGSGDAIYMAAISASGTFLNIRDNNINGISISTGGSATSNPYLTNGYANSTNVTYDITGSNIRSTWTHFRVRIPTLNDGTQRFYTVIGWKASAAANDNQTAYFTYDLDGTQTGSSASVNWQTVSALGGNREWTTTSSAVPANTWQTLSIRATTTAIQFYIDGTLVATHTTRIPAAGRMHMQIFKTNGTTARFLDVDYATFNQLNQSDR